MKYIFLVLASLGKKLMAGKQMAAAGTNGCKSPPRPASEALQTLLSR